MDSLIVKYELLPIGCESFIGTVIDKQIKKTKYAFFKLNSYYVQIMTNKSRIYKYKIKNRDYMRMTIGTEIKVRCKKC